MLDFIKKEWKFIGNGNGTETSLDSTDTETFKKDPIASLARELCQNSLDARREEKPVKVEFKPFEIYSKDFPGLKKFREELVACRDSYEKNSKYYNAFEMMIKTVDEEKIECLRISDFNTIGLEGVKDNDRKKAFYYLTKGNGLTTKIGLDSGGSKGIGKFASFVASKLQTVFYYTLNVNEEKGYIGIAKLASRELDPRTQECTTGYGYFCKPEKVSPILDKLSLDKSFEREDNEYGTDVYIMAFKKQDEWKEEIISQVLESFMYAINNNDMEVIVDDVTINKDTLYSIVNDSRFILESNYKSIKGQYILLNDEFVHKKEVNIMELGNVTIYLKAFTRSEEDLATNKCTMIRYPYMKIKEERIPFPVPCAAMCVIGKNDLNSKLKEIENPQHTDWEPNRLEKDAKKNIRKIIRTIKKEIEEFAKECLVSSESKEIDMYGLGDYLADFNTDDGDDYNDGDEPLEEKPKILEKIKNRTKNKYGEKHDDNGLTPENDIGTHIEEGNDSSVPSGHNNNSSNTPHDGDNNEGFDSDGEDEIVRLVQLNGINTKVIVPDKNSGVYNVVFFSIYDENNCELEISYMDDNGSKYSPEIYECKINGVPTKVEDGIIKEFKIEKDKKYIVSLKTNLRDFYTCEVKIYANR